LGEALLLSQVIECTTNNETKGYGMKLYRTNDWRPEITEVEATRTTEKSIWTIRKDYNGKEREERSALHSEYCDYWNTLEEAKAYHLKRLAKSIETLTEKIKIANEDILKVKEYVL
jgi:hypothetical protein